jgi:predicted oxidoreductase
MSTTESISNRQSAAPAREGPIDAEVDVIVAGGGVAGLSTALFARWLGDTVVLLEKSAEIGGTALKAAFWYWVPNNQKMQELGIADRKEDCIRYMARLSQPQRYNPHESKFGLTDWEYAQCEAIYDSASPASELLRERGALPYRHCADVPDYWAELAEDKAPRGRVLLPEAACNTMSDGGKVAVETMLRAARRDGIDIRTSHQVRRVIKNAFGEVIGVEATINGDRSIRIGARKAVVFATGGFIHNPELRQNFLHVPLFGGCATLSNEGDFVYIASALGAQLRNMNYAWMCPVSLEKAVARARDLSGMFSVSGDSMIWVDKTGRRVTNEKLAYNELAQTFFQWDPIKAEYPYLVLIALWDQRSQDHSASAEYGRLIVPPGTDDAHVLRGKTWAELTRAISERLHRYAHVTGGAKLSDDFAENLKTTVARFNGFARNSRDEDFHRGERLVEQLFNGPVKEETDRRNPTMWPISDAGPYYAALVTGGSLDTKGGPKTTPEGQVVDDQNKPIPGLYGVGNCVASASGRSYWAGGATIGPILAFAYRAARAAHAEQVKEPEKRASVLVSDKLY